MKKKNSGQKSRATVPLMCFAARNQLKRKKNSYNSIVSSRINSSITSLCPYIGIILADYPSFCWRLATLTHFMGVATLYVATLTRSNFDPVATLTP